MQRVTVFPSPRSVRIYKIMAGYSPDPDGPKTPRGHEDELMAIPRLAEEAGLSPRVLRYWEEQGLISPTRERGKLRYSPRDLAIARLTRRLMDSGVGVEGIRMLKELVQRDIERAARSGDERALTEAALRILYERKTFEEVTRMKEEHYPEGHRPPPGGPRHGPGKRHAKEPGPPHGG
jgi:DNA-binding transcriptional MerR regulator